MSGDRDDSTRLSPSEMLLVGIVLAAMGVVLFVVVRWMVTTRSGMIFAFALTFVIVIAGVLGAFKESRAEREWRDRVPVPAAPQRPVLQPAGRAYDVPNLSVRCTGSGITEWCEIRTW